MHILVGMNCANTVPIEEFANELNMQHTTQSMCVNFSQTVRFFDRMRDAEICPKITE
jgi:hypothetical protein